MKPPLGRQITGKMKRSTFGVERSKVQVTRRQVSKSRQEDDTVNFWDWEVQGPGHATSGLQITDKKIKRSTFGVERSKVQVTRRQVSKSRTRRWNGELLRSKGPRSRSRDFRSPNHGQEDETVNFCGREVQGPGHAMPKLDLETWRRQRSWSLHSSRFSR